MSDSVVFDISLKTSDADIDKKIEEMFNKRNIDQPQKKVRRSYKKRKSITTSGAPAPTTHDSPEGGIYGGNIDDPRQQSFKRMQAHGGAVPQVRGNEKQPAPNERWIKQNKRMEDKLIELDNRTESLRDLFKKFGSGVSGGSGLATNPGNFISGKIMELLGRAGPIGAIVVAIIAAPKLIEKLAMAIIKQLSVKGGTLNDDFKIIIEDAVTDFLTLEQEYKRKIGDDGFVVSFTGGYTTIKGTDVTNSKLESSEIRINRKQVGE